MTSVIPTSSVIIPTSSVIITTNNNTDNNYEFIQDFGESYQNWIYDKNETLKKTINLMYMIIENKLNLISLLSNNTTIEYEVEDPEETMVETLNTIMKNFLIWCNNEISEEINEENNNIEEGSNEFLQLIILNKLNEIYRIIPSNLIS